MTIEYHGWVALATSQTEWSDSDFEDAFRQVESLIRTLPAENGHDPIMPEGTLLPRVVYFKGIGVESVTPVVRVVEMIAKVLDQSYGEITVFEEGHGTTTRLCLHGGRINNMGSQQADGTLRR